MDDEEGLAANLIKRAGGAPERVARPSTPALAKLPKVSGDAGQVYLDQQTAKVLDEAEKIAKKAGDSFVPVERHADGAGRGEIAAKDALEAGAVTRRR
jgi:ATP-dependent Clp protease ATP-binding subunit ClpB